MEQKEKQIKIMDLLFEFYDPLVLKFLDTESDKHLDEKIEVLVKLKNGVPPIEIPNYYDILELIPKKGIWD